MAPSTLQQCMDLNAQLLRDAEAAEERYEAAKPRVDALAAWVDALQAEIRQARRLEQNLTDKFRAAKERSSSSRVHAEVQSARLKEAAAAVAEREKNRCRAWNEELAAASEMHMPEKTLAAEQLLTEDGDLEPAFRRERATMEQRMLEKELQLRSRLAEERAALGERCELEAAQEALRCGKLEQEVEHQDQLFAARQRVTGDVEAERAVYSTMAEEAAVSRVELKAALDTAAAKYQGLVDRFERWRRQQMQAYADLRKVPQAMGHRQASQVAHLRSKIQDLQAQLSLEEKREAWQPLDQLQMSGEVDSEADDVMLQLEVEELATECALAASEAGWPAHSVQKEAGGWSAARYLLGEFLPRLKAELRARPLEAGTQQHSVKEAIATRSAAAAGHMAPTSLTEFQRRQEVRQTSNSVKELVEKGPWSQGVPPPTVRALRPHSYWQWQSEKDLASAHKAVANHAVSLEGDLDRLRRRVASLRVGL